MFDKFFKDFDRPSQNAIQSGWSPNTPIWDKTKKGLEVKKSISIIEGTKEISIERVTPKEVTIKIRRPAPPTMITVREIYPAYFKGLRSRHKGAIARMARKKRVGFRKIKK
jgi:hypothetical protein